MQESEQIINSRLGFIGCGHLGSALIDAILERKLYPPGRLFVCDRHMEKIRRFSGVQQCASAFEVAHNAGTIFLLVKPQDIREAMQGAQLTDRVLVSMVAGITCDELRANIRGCGRVLRVMTNLAIKYGMGATAYEVPNNLAPVEQERVLNIFRTMGMVESLNEDQMDVATAISGSGPAYVMYFLDAMIKAAQGEGMSFDAADRLVLQTARGAIAMLAENAEPADRIIDQVCSPGGTTEAALKVLRRRNIRDAVDKAVDTATRRCRDLADMLKGRPTDDHLM